MKKKILILIGAIITIILFMLVFLIFKKDKTNQKVLEATVLKQTTASILVQDENSIIYNLKVNKKQQLNNGEDILITYTGVLDKNVEDQDVTVISYKTIKTNAEAYKVSMFNDYSIQAKELLKNMTLEEKVGQMFLVRVPEEMQIEPIKEFKIGGYVMFERDFEDRTKDQIIDKIKSYQNASKIPLLIAVDEEGGSVVRVSNNPNLRSEAFKSPRELYLSGGMSLIEEDTKEKSKLLSKLGINLNLAPVVDVSTDSSNYIYPRTIGENTNVTSEYAETVIKASKVNDVSYTLKHFPGYGYNEDTHKGSSQIYLSYNNIMSEHIPPFKYGINAGAEAVLMSHNIYTSIDKNNPASLSVSAHNLLRNTLDFTGVIITDDISMSALDNVDDKIIKAVNSGNDIIISTNYSEDINILLNAVKTGKISEEQINHTVLKILSWKYYKGLMELK